MDAARYAKRPLAKSEDFYPQLVRALEKHRGKGLWVHFTDIPKIGIRPSISHKDPVGIYLFPLDHIADEFSRYHHWAFRRYMFVCRVSAGNVLDLSTVTATDMESALAALGVQGEPEARSGEPGEKLWRALDEAAREGGEWGTKRGMAFRRILKRLGYDAVRDPGTGTIHSNEPDQFLVLDLTDIEVVEMVETTTRPYDADAYYRDPKYPFRGRSTKPAVELLRSLSAAAGLSPGRVGSQGKGSWELAAEDAEGNKIRLGEELLTSGSADYVSFRVKFSASWHSDGRQVYERGDGPHGHGYEFEMRSEYGEVVAPFASQLKAKMEQLPPDDTSYVEEPLREIARALGGAKVSTTSPVRGEMAKRIGTAELRVFLGFEHPESSHRAEMPSYDVSGVVKLPKAPEWGDQIAIDPSFGHDIEPIPADGVVSGVLEGLPVWLEGVLEAHFPEGDARYDHIRRHTRPVIDLLASPAPPTLASRYHAACVKFSVTDARGRRRG